MKPRESALYHPTVSAQSRSVLLSAAGDHWLYAAPSQLATVLIEVIAAVGEQSIGAPARPPDLTPHWADPVDQRKELGEVVAIPAGQRDRQRHSGGVGDQMVL
jgi:hypothetical protein